MNVTVAVRPSNCGWAPNVTSMYGASLTHAGPIATMSSDSAGHASPASVNTQVSNSDPSCVRYAVTVRSPSSQPESVNATSSVSAGTVTVSLSAPQTGSDVGCDHSDPGQGSAVPPVSVSS